MPEINPGFKETVLIPDGRMYDEAFRYYRMRWNVHPVWGVVNRVPIHLDLEVTARCQLKCPGCPSTVLTFEKGDMGVDMAKNLIEEFATNGGSSIKFNWRGEPTLYEHLPEVVEMARERGIVDRMINTNGVALDSKLSEKLVDAGISTVAFSIDSMNDERYAKLRPGAVLGKVEDNLRLFLKEKARRDSKVYVRVQRIEYPDEQVSHNDFVDHFAWNFPGLNSVASNRYKAKEIEGSENYPSEPCAQLWQRLIVTHDGWMGPCCEFNRFGVKKFGRYPHTTIGQVWNSLELKQLRKFHEEGRQNEIEACKRCTVTKKVEDCKK